MSLINEKVSFYIIKIWSFEQYFKCWPGYLSSTLKPYSKNTMYICWYSLHNDEEIHGQSVLHNTDLFYAIVKVSIFNQHIICQWTWRITVWYTLSKLTLAAKFFFSKRQSKIIKWGQFPECLFQHPKYMIIYGLVERGQKMSHMYNIMPINKKQIL